MSHAIFTAIEQLRDSVIAKTNTDDTTIKVWVEGGMCVVHTADITIQMPVIVMDTLKQHPAFKH